MALRDSGLVQQCSAESLRLLARNLTPGGIMAATPGGEAQARAYTRVFGRDAGICALAMSASGNADLQQGAIDSLASLAALQAPNGQIPKYVDPEGRDADFWYLGCIDATLWWLIAVDSIRRTSSVSNVQILWQDNVERALHWLQAQEHQRFFLLQQNEASDWADIMPRSGFVLYTNALWYHVKGLFDLPKRSETHHHFNHLFHPFGSDLPEYRRARLLRHYANRGRRESALYLSFVNLAAVGDEGDVFGNLLAILFGLAGTSRAEEMLQTMSDLGCSDPFPVRVVTQPITQEDPRWRLYMARHGQNHPHQYHNGGIWPFVGGFLVMALVKQNLRQRAGRELASLALANSLEDWRFTEWFHGKTLQPMGMAGQSWNAATFLLAKTFFETGCTPIAPA